MQAIILAAGMGTRLKELTNNNTKCMVKVNGVSIISRMLGQLDNLNLNNITIVTGYKSDELKDYIGKLNIHTPIKYITNDIYYKTNNIYSLCLAKECLLMEDTILLESDLIFEESILKKIITNPYPNLALVAKYENWMDGTVVTIDEDDNIKSFINKKEFNFDNADDYYKTVNIYKFSRSFSNTHYVPFLEAYNKALGNDEYYEQVLKVISLLDKPEIKAIKLDKELWYEIDDQQDLDIAESIFSNSSKEKLVKFQSRYGGYWRYPGLIDFCYLVNPFYPPERLVDEIKTNFQRLICDYPSGQEVNSLLAAKYFGIDKRKIVVGNGAAELIKSIMNKVEGNLGIIMPTFAEYPNRRNLNNVIEYYPENRDFKYSANDLIKFYDNKDISSLLLINPDNPSGNYIGKLDVLKIANWAQEKNIIFIVDESFVDFAEEKEASIIDENILKDYPNLIVIKSISKSFGVPGLRLGVLASGNIELIEFTKGDISIWNINSFAEFYMQIFEKYKNDYKSALIKFKEVRKQYIEKLSYIKNIRVIPTQANYVMCELLGSNTATELTERLLSEKNILIKDLSNKKGIDGEFIRIAVKKPEENDNLVDAIKEIIK